MVDEGSRALCCRHLVRDLGVVSSVYRPSIDDVACLLFSLLVSMNLADDGNVVVVPVYTGVRVSLLCSDFEFG